MTKFLIVATGYNCENFVNACYQGLKFQAYPHWNAVFVSDGSTDNTLHELRKTEDERVDIFHFHDNRGAAFRRHQVISNSHIDEETVVVLLGLDDSLLMGALNEIHNQYQAGKWMTYGNWVNQHGKGLPANFALDFDNETHLKRDYRKVKYRSTAPNTFKKFLFDRIPESDFQIDSKWITTTTESELMFSCLEMCGRERIGIITKPIYLYNQFTSNNRNTDMVTKMKVYNEIISRPKKELYEGRA